MQNKRGRMIALFTPKPTRGPLHPHEGYPHEEKTNQIGNNKGPAPILYGLNRKSQKISSTDRIAGHRENETQSRAPGFVVIAHEDGLLKAWILVVKSGQFPVPRYGVGNPSPGWLC